MFGIGFGLSDQRVPGGGVPLPPPTTGFTDPYATVAGALPSYQHPGASYLSEAAGTFGALGGWTVGTGAPDIAAGRVLFPASAGTQSVTHALSLAIPAGATVRVQWRQGGLGGARLGLVGEPPLDYAGAAGWHAGSFITTALRDTLVIEAQPGSVGLTVTDVSVTVIVEPAAYDIILLMGGANMTGQSCAESPDPLIDYPHPLVDVWTGSGANGAVAPLQHLEANLGLGPGLAFAREYAERAVSPGRRVLIVPVGKSGSRLVDAGASTGAQGAASGWHPLNTFVGGQDLYSTAVTETLAAEGMNLQVNRVVAAVWSGGEREALDTFQIGAYQSGLRDYLIPSLRHDLVRADLPFVILGTNPVAVPPIWGLIEAALDETSGAPEATPGVVHVAWDPGWGNGTRPSPGSTAEAQLFSGAANRVRGAAGAVELAGRLPAYTGVGVIAAATVIDSDVLVTV